MMNGIFASWTQEDLVKFHGNWQSMTSKKSIGTLEKKSYSLTCLEGAEHTAWLKKKEREKKQKNTGGLREGHGNNIKATL